MNYYESPETLDLVWSLVVAQVQVCKLQMSLENDCKLWYDILQCRETNYPISRLNQSNASVSIVYLYLNSRELRQQASK
jgi:hypothetical protein